MMICSLCMQEQCDCEKTYGLPTRIEYKGQTPDGYAPQIHIEQSIQCWAKIHSYTGCEKDWLEEWEKTIPCGVCAAGYAEFKQENPPDFSSPEALWLWGVGLHNWINTKLLKPVVSIEEARRIWGR